MSEEEIELGDDYQLKIHKGEPFKQDQEQIKQFFKFLDHEHPTAYQLFYPKDADKPPQGHKFIDNAKQAVKYCKSNRLQGLNCFGINQRPDKGTKSGEIQHLDVILFDVDVPREKRPEYGVASKEQVKEAYRTVENLQEKMEELGFSMDYLDFSGNGFHPGFKVDVEIEDAEDYKETEVYRKLEKLEEIGNQVSTENVEIDAITKDFARRVKIPGTWNIKSYKDEDGEWQPVPEEKWRRAELLHKEEEPCEEQNTEAFQQLELQEQEAEPSEKPSMDVETPENKRIKWVMDHDYKFKKLYQDETGELENDYDSRSEKEMALCVLAESYGFDKDKILSNSAFTKWEEDGEKYQKHTSDKAEDVVSNYFDWGEWEERNEKGRKKLLKDFKNELNPEDTDDSIDLDEVEEKVFDKIEELEDLEGIAEKSRKKKEIWELLHKTGEGFRQEFYGTISGNKRDDEKAFQEWRDKLNGDNSSKVEIDQNLEEDNLKEARYQLSSKLVDDRDIISVKKGVNNQGHEFYYYDTSEKVWKGDGEQQIRKTLRNAMEEHYTRHHRKEVQDQIKAIKQKHLEEMGLKEGEIPVQNGILQLNGEKEVRDIEKQDYILWKLPVEYDEKVQLERFEELLDDWKITGKVRRKLQEFIGYCLMHWTASREKSLMILGPTDSGKSVFLDIIRNLFGKGNCANESLQDITNTRWSTANLEGHPVNIDHDLDTDAINDIGKAKKVISGNPITVEQKGVQPYKLEPTTKHLFSANKAPERTDEEEAFYNRWLTVVFPKQVEDDQQIDKEELMEEINFSGVLNWAIEGMERLKEQGGFTGEVDPLETQELWKEYGDHFDRFISNYCIKKKHYKQEDKESNSREDITWKVELDTIYSVYEEYAEGRVGNVLSKKKFSKRMKKENGVRKKDSMRMPQKDYPVRGFRGIVLAENAYKEASKE
jgi:P4 family phage/plasmid primase-like protien